MACLQPFAQIGTPGLIELTLYVAIFIFYAYLNFTYETLTDIILNDCKYISVYNIFKRIGISRP